MRRKVASRKYLFCEKYSAGPEQGRLFPLVRGVFLVRKEGFPERKLLERGSDALSALLSRSSCFHFALHDSLRDTRPLSPYDQFVMKNGIQFGFDAQHSRFNPYESE